MFFSGKQLPIAIFDSLEDFLKVHVKPHPDNKTLITFEDGEQKEY